MTIRLSDGEEGVVMMVGVDGEGVEGDEGGVKLDNDKCVGGLRWPKWNEVELAELPNVV